MLIRKIRQYEGGENVKYIFFKTSALIFLYSRTLRYSLQAHKFAQHLEAQDQRQRKHWDCFPVRRQTKSEGAGRKG